MPIEPAPDALESDALFCSAPWVDEPTALDDPAEPEELPPFMGIGVELEEPRPGTAEIDGPVAPPL